MSDFTVTVKSEKCRGFITYRPICKNAKMLANIANTQSLSTRMIDAVVENGYKVIDLEPTEKKRKKAL